MSMIQSDLLLGQEGGAGYTISRSLRFNASDSAFLSRTPSSSGNRRTWTWAGWVKKAVNTTTTPPPRLFGAGAAGTGEAGITLSGDSIEVYRYAGSYSFQLVTSAKLRDPSAWYHLLIAFDTTQATTSNRIKIYINGVEQTAFSTSNYPPTQNADYEVNNTGVHTLGFINGGGSSDFLNGYLADIHFIDGQALTPSSFTEVSATTGQLIPKAYTGSFGTNGFWLKFSDNSAATAATLGKDYSGNNNNWSPNNVSVITGGPTSVAAASGALPIFNTTDTYGATKGTGTRTDANSSAIVLALPMDGANNGTTFSDQSSTIKGSGSAKTATVNGNSKTSTAISKFYGSSGAFDGSGDYLTFASNADFDFGTGDFSVESWVYLNSLPSGNGYPSSYWIVGWGPSDSNPGFDFAVGSSNLILAISNFAAPTISVAHGMSAGRWYHLAATRSGNTARVFIDGVQIGSATTTETASSNPNGIAVCAAEPAGATGGNLNGYLQDLRIYKGVAKYTSNFNPPSSTQNPTIAAGFDSTVDTPTSGSQVDTGLGGQVTGNYCTLNPLNKNTNCLLSNGNLDFSTAVAGAVATPAIGTVGVSSGKWYWECVRTSGTFSIFGIAKSNKSTVLAIGYDALSWGYRYSGDKVSNSALTTYGATWGSNDVIGVAFDADNGTLTFYKNGVSQGTAFTGLTDGPYFPAAGDYQDTGFVNFGQRPFAYTAPSGFKALCDTNLPAPVVAKPSTVMDVKLYTGNGSTQTISGLGFSPDLVWVKQRNGGEWNILTDAIRGDQKSLFSNATNSEDTGRGISLLGSGFSVDSWVGVNTNAGTYVGWCWDAGSSTVTNTQGSITSQVRANASAGFSVVSYTGISGYTSNINPGTVGHGLNAEPHLLIVKNRDVSGEAWQVYHKSLGNDKNLILNSTSAAGGPSNEWWNSTTPTSSVFSVRNSGAVNGLNQKIICYAFAPVAGYSSFGSYVGNGSSDGVFVYTGFRPRWLLLKGSNVVGGQWFIVDAARNTANVLTNYLQAESSAAEVTASAFADFCSNGFKMRDPGVGINGNGSTYIYACFAESPFQYARAR